MNVQPRKRDAKTEAQLMLRLARENARRTGRVGNVTMEHVTVSAHRRAGFWSYDVGTAARSHAEGRPQRVLPALMVLVEEAFARFDERTAELRSGRVPS